MLTQGKRVADNTKSIELKIGEYSFQTWTKIPHWIIRDPTGDIGSIWGNSHVVTIHEDKSITVCPSLLSEHGNKWHGYLEQGIWREC